MRTKCRCGTWVGASLVIAGLVSCVEPPATTGPTPGGAAIPLSSDTGPTARVWQGGSLAAAPAGSPAVSAMALVDRLAPQWGAGGGTVDLEPLATVSVRGGDIVRLAQRIDGVPVDDGELRVMVG